MAGLTPAELAAARLFRGQQRAALAKLDPPDITVSVFVRQYRHNCSAQNGKSVALELREHYVRSPLYRVCYCSVVAEQGPDFPHRDCDGSVIAAEAGRFAFIWTEGRCNACGTTARSSRGRLVDSAERPPADHAIVVSPA